MAVGRDGSILVTKRAPERSQGGMWMLPGGAVMLGETPRQAAKRALLAETGIAVDADMLLYCGCGRRGLRFSEYFLCFPKQTEVRLAAGRTAASDRVAPQRFLEMAAGEDFDGAQPRLYTKYFGGVFAGCRIPPTAKRDMSRRENRMPELADLCDASGRPTGRTAVRGERIPADTYRTVVSILTVTRSGEILLTRRAPQKSYAGCWEITGGCAQAGETPVQAAVRELWEETGLLTSPAELEDRGMRRERGVIFRYFLLRRDLTAADIRLQKGETDAAEIVSLAEFRARWHAGLTVTQESTLITLVFPDILGGSTESTDETEEEKL